MSATSYRRPVLAGLVLTLLGAGLAAWWLSRTPPVDMVAVLQANNRGVGLMEQFQYGKAIEAFEDVLRLAPDWRPAQINLGIALLNKGEPDYLKRATRVFQKVLASEPDNPYAHYCLGIIFYHQGQAEEAA